MKRFGQLRPGYRLLAVLGAYGRDAGDELGAFYVDAAVALAQRQQLGRELAVHRRQRRLVLFAVLLLAVQADAGKRCMRCLPCMRSDMWQWHQDFDVMLSQVTSWLLSLAAKHRCC